MYAWIKMKAEKRNGGHCNVQVREWITEPRDLENGKERAYKKAHGLKLLHLITYCGKWRVSLWYVESKNIELKEMEIRIVVAKENGETLIKGCKLSVIRAVSSEDQMCRVVIK